MKKLWMKVGTIALAMVMMVGGICLNTLAATEEQITNAEKALKSATTNGTFNNAAVAENSSIAHAGAMQPGGWQLVDKGLLSDYPNTVKFATETVSSNTTSDMRIMAIVEDAEKYPGINGKALKMINPYGWGTDDTLALSWNVRHTIYEQIPGETYKLSARVFIHKGATTNPDVSVLFGATCSNKKLSDFLAYKTMTGSAETYDQWVDLTLYFAGTAGNYNWFDIYLAVDLESKGTDGYVLWDDVKIETVDAVSFHGEATELEGGKSYGATLVLGSLEAEVKSYTMLKSIYVKGVNDVLVLKKVVVEPITVTGVKKDVNGNNMNAGQYVENITFDLTGYSVEDDYVVKVMVWKNGVADMEPAYIGEKD